MLSTGSKFGLAILTLIIVYFAIVLLMWLLPSPRILDCDGCVDHGKLFGYSAAVLGVLFVVSLILGSFSMVGPKCKPAACAPRRFGY